MVGDVLSRSVLAVSLLTLLLSAGGAAAPQADPQIVNVVAKRFEFEPSTITVSVGQPVRLLVRSADGVHGIEIKKFKVSKDIPRGGEAVVINFTPTTTGEFPIMCSEYCGDGHDDMRGMLVVQARDTANP